MVTFPDWYGNQTAHKSFYMGGGGHNIDFVSVIQLSYLVLHQSIWRTPDPCSHPQCPQGPVL